MRPDGIKGVDPGMILQTLTDNGVSAVFYYIMPPATEEELERTRELGQMFGDAIQFHLWIPVYRNPRYLEASAEDVFIAGNQQPEPGWINPMSSGYQSRLVQEIGSLVWELEPDGIFLDYFYVPLGPFDNETVRRYSGREGANLSVGNITSDPDALGRFLEWRNEFILETLGDLRRATEGLDLSVFIIMLQEADRLARGQDVAAFAEIVDFLVPNTYHFEARRGSSWVGGGVLALKDSGAGSVWSGIQAYNIPEREIRDAIRSALRSGAEGVVLFRYGTMTEEYWKQARRGMAGGGLLLVYVAILGVVLVIGVVWLVRRRIRTRPRARKRRR
jgi:hypothetical protein